MLTWRIGWAPNNASKWQMGFNMAFKGLKSDKNSRYLTWKPMYIYFNISLNSAKKEKWFRQKMFRKLKHWFPFLINFFLVFCLLWDSVEKCGRNRQATDDNITRRKYFSRRITKATDTHSEFVIIIAFPRKKWLGETASILSNTNPPCLDFSKMSLRLALGIKKV